MASVSMAGADSVGKRSCASDLLPSRRALVTQAALFGAASAAMTSPLAAAPTPGPIEIAFAEYARLVEVECAASNTTFAIQQHHEDPPLPRFRHFIDQGGFTHKQVSAEPRRYLAYVRMDNENVAALRAQIAQPFDPSGSDPENVELDRKNYARDVERAQETLAIVEAYRAQRDRIRDACGLTAAIAAGDAAKTAMEAQAAAIHAMKPANVRELTFQAAVLRYRWDEDAADLLIERLMRFANIDPWDDLAPEEIAA